MVMAPSPMTPATVSVLRPFAQGDAENVEECDDHNRQDGVEEIRGDADIDHLGEVVQQSRIFREDVGHDADAGRRDDGKRPAGT